MAKISLKILLIALISSFVFFFNSDNTKSCGPEYIFDDFYKIFETDLFDEKNLTPFLLTEYIFKGVDEDGSVGPRFDNLKEWLDYFENKPTIDDLEIFIYETTIQDLEAALEKNPSNSLNNNSVFLYSERQKIIDAIEYLKFAKQCEPFVAEYDPWNPPTKDVASMNSLIETAVLNFNKTKCIFFKNRFAYQAIRLAHYSEQFEKTISLFKGFFKKSENKGLMYYWSLGHCAGATRSSGNSAKANVLFARVFDNCPSKSRQSVLSFRYWNDSLFTETLKSCENQHDSVLVYTIGAYKNSELNRTSIQTIYSLEPESKYLELLLFRAISILERNVLPIKDPWDGYRTYLTSGYHYTTPLPIDSFLYKTVFKIANENRVSNSHLWNYAAGYIASLQNNSDQADKYFFEAKRLCPKENLDFVKRVQIAEIICFTNSLKSITNKDEDILNKKLTWLENNSNISKLHSNDAFYYIMNTLAIKYWAQGDTLKSHLCFGIKSSADYSGYSYDNTNVFNYKLEGNYHNEPIEKLFLLVKDFQDTYSTKSSVSAFEKFLFKNYSYSSQELSNILAKENICKGRFEQAKTYLKYSNYSDSEDNSEALYTDPFIMNINDCHDCDWKVENVTRYSLLSFTNQMLELLVKVSKEDNPNKAADYYYMLANGYYNITFFGNCWNASSYYREFNYPAFFEGSNYAFYDCSRAEECYLKAARLTKKKEFAARCYFMAAKCEQNRYYNDVFSQKYSYYSMSEQDMDKLKFDNYKIYFKKLTNDYSKTKFFKEALKECKYFNYFVTGK